MIRLDEIRAAAARAAPHVRRTPLLDVGSAHLKLEVLQPTGSFKVRGFFSAALALPPERLRAGLLTVSAGNAALACAHVAHSLGIPCRVVMFDTVTAPKLEGVRRLGAEAVLMPRAEVLAWMAAEAWTGEQEVFIHPFADERVMAGHGGAGLEIMEDLPALRRLLVPVGGGGLIAGIASAVRGLGTGVEVIGVQSSGYPLWPSAITAGGDPALTPATIADGTSAPFLPGMLERMVALVDRWIIVPEPRLRRAVAELAALGKVVAEGAGALAFAALDQLDPGPVTAAVISGGNIDRRLLASLLG